MKNKKHNVKIVFLLIIVILISITCYNIITIFIIENQTNNDDFLFKEIKERRAVVIRAFENSLGVMLLDEPSGELWHIAYGKEGNIGFEKGQEIVFYYHGIIHDTYPRQVSRY